MLVQGITSSIGSKLELRRAKITLHCILLKLWIVNSINLFSISNSNFDMLKQVIWAPRHSEIGSIVPEVCKKKLDVLQWWVDVKTEYKRSKTCGDVVQIGVVTFSSGPRFKPEPTRTWPWFSPSFVPREELNWWSSYRFEMASDYENRFEPEWTCNFYRLISIIDYMWYYHCHQLTLRIVSHNALLCHKPLLFLLSYFFPTF